MANLVFSRARYAGGPIDLVFGGGGGGEPGVWPSLLAGTSSLSGITSSGVLTYDNRNPRRVRLHRQSDGLLVKDAWSDAVTGEYVFNYVAAGTYYVASFDHTGQFGGVIETDVVAEPMGDG